MLLLDRHSRVQTMFAFEFKIETSSNLIFIRSLIKIISSLMNLPIICLIFILLDDQFSSTKAAFYLETCILVSTRQFRYPIPALFAEGLLKREGCSSWVLPSKFLLKMLVVYRRRSWQITLARRSQSHSWKKSPGALSGSSRKSCSAISKQAILMMLLTAPLYS